MNIDVLSVKDKVQRYLTEFYEQVVRPTFERGGVFYILPDKASLAETFPEFAQSRATAQHDDEKVERSAH